MSREPAYDKINQAQADNPKKADEPYYDDELVENGGPYRWKKAIGQVTVRWPLKPDFLAMNWIALIYGFLPWIIPISFGVHWIITRKFIMLYGVCVAIVPMVLNEAILKPIIKDPRPRQTANRHKDGSIKYGMPSGHVLNSTTIMVWALLEVICDGPGLHGQNEELTIEWVSLVLVLMAPVAWARWYNLDHTWKQCLVSLVLGLFFGALAFYLRVKFFSTGSRWKPWSEFMVTTAAPEVSTSGPPVLL